MCSDWARAAGVALGDAGVLQVDLPTEPLGVCCSTPSTCAACSSTCSTTRAGMRARPRGAIELRLDSRDETRAFLSVASDGAPIPPEVERYLFEPFFSTRSRGTGLGLYICRELCERYGASIDYRARPAANAHRNEFSVAMRRSVPLRTAPKPDCTCTP